MEESQHYTQFPLKGPRRRLLNFYRRQNYPPTPLPPTGINKSSEGPALELGCLKRANTCSEFCSTFPSTANPVPALVVSSPRMLPFHSRVLCLLPPQQDPPPLGPIAFARRRESANFLAMRPNDGYQKFGLSLGSEIRLFTSIITQNLPKKSNIKFQTSCVEKTGAVKFSP